MTGDAMDEEAIVEAYRWLRNLSVFMTLDLIEDGSSADPPMFTLTATADGIARLRAMTEAE